MSDEAPAADEGRGLSPLQVSVAVIGVVIVAFIVLLATRDPQQRPANNAVVGESVPPVAGLSYDGSTFDIEDILLANRTSPAAEQQWVVVNFFASWCVPCEIEHPELIRFDQEGAACPTRLVGVAIRDTEAGVIDFFERRGGGWPVLVGDTNTTIIDFSVTAPPETIIVAPSGLVVRKIIGATTYDDLVESIPC